MLLNNERQGVVGRAADINQSIYQSINHKIDYTTYSCFSLTCANIDRKLFQRIGEDIKDHRKSRVTLGRVDEIVGPREFVCTRSGFGNWSCR